MARYGRFSPFVSLLYLFSRLVEDSILKQPQDFVRLSVTLIPAITFSVPHSQRKSQCQSRPLLMWCGLIAVNLLNFCPIISFIKNHPPVKGEWVILIHYLPLTGNDIAILPCAILQVKAMWITRSQRNENSEFFRRIFVSVLLFALFYFLMCIIANQQLNFYHPCVSTLYHGCIYRL